MDENGGGLHGGAPAGQVTRLDAMIIGAGVAGLYQLHQLRALEQFRADRNLFSIHSSART